jgi:exosortase A-associated hydrolase 1
MSVQERAITIRGPQADMLGIVSQPAADQPASTTGVVIVVGGAQYRVGSHRQFIQLARHLAAHGYPVLRFDFPGMGDSPGESSSFEDTAPHIQAAIDHLQTACPGVQRVVLWGLCDGASASLLYLEATQDPRVAGLALLNPWVRSEVGLARAQVKYYYRQRVLEPAFWRKLFTGGVGWQALRSFGSTLRTMRSRPTQAIAATFQERMAQAWRAFPGPILLLLSQRDLTAQEFDSLLRSEAAWIGALDSEKVSCVALVDADHTCSHPNAKQMVLSSCLSWLSTAQKKGDHRSPF